MGEGGGGSCWVGGKIKIAAPATTLVTGYVLISWWKMYYPKIKKKEEVRIISFYEI